MLTALLVSEGRLVPVDALIEELWGSGPPSNPENALQAHVSRLRRTLEALEPQSRDQRLITHPYGYQLSVADDEVDARIFMATVQTLAAQMGTCPPAEMAGRLRDALSVWRGPPFGGIIGGRICQGGARRYEEVRLRALEMLFDVELASGRHADVIADLSALVATQSQFQARYCEQLMLALYRSGRQVDALAVYRRTWEQIAGAVDHRTAEQLRGLERAILEHNPVLELAPMRGPGGPAGANGARAGLQGGPARAGGRGAADGQGVPGKVGAMV